MNDIKEIVNDLAECFDGNGVPNMDYVKTKVKELQKVVNKNDLLPRVICRFLSEKAEAHGLLNDETMLFIDSYDKKNYELLLTDDDLRTLESYKLNGI